MRASYPKSSSSRIDHFNIKSLFQSSFINKKGSIVRLNSDTPYCSFMIKPKLNKFKKMFVEKAKKGSTGRLNSLVITDE